MKTAVRNVIGDLVEKRLWPVAVALIVAIVAIPLVLARGGASAPAPATQPSGAATGTPEPAVRLVDAGAGTRDRAGRVRNPFGSTGASAASASGSATAAPAVPASASVSASGASSSAGTAEVTAPAATSSASAAASSSPAASSLPAASPAPATPKTSTTTTTAKSNSGTSATYSVAVRFGRTDGGRQTLRNIARLTALPTAKAPVVSLLGVLRDGRTAVLKVGANATASGNGTCKPSAARCTTVELKAGDAEYFRVAVAGSDTVAWYYLKLLHVDRHETTSKVVAAAAYARRSAAGMAVVRKDASSVRSYRYLPGLGVLVRAKHRTRPAGRTAAAGGGEALLPAAKQDGVPVWRSLPRAGKR